jgi:HEAT repeat protein
MVSKVRKSQTSAHLRWMVTGILLFACAAAVAQAPDNDFLDSFGLARMKDYSSHRLSSGSRFVLSNDDSKRIMPGQTFVMADISGAGMITHLWLTIAQNEFAWPRRLRLRVYYDGQKTPSVDAPLGDFFAVGHGAERDVNSMMVRDSSFGRARNSYWPMPFQKSCRITLTNEGHRVVPMFYYHVDYRRYASLPANLGYLHAYYRQERPAHRGHNYAFLDAKGNGHYVGTVLSVTQTEISWFGEGDDLFYIDGAHQPQIYGTGTEDYFNDAWGLRDVTGPWTGTPIAEGELPGSRLSAYRWHVPDPIVFTKSIWAGIEHAGWTANPDGSVRSGFEERADNFSSVAFWYQKGVNEGLSEPPYGDERLPFGNATQIPIEDSIKDVTTQNGEASVLRDVDWSKDLLFFKANGVGSRLNVPINVTAEGLYEIVAEIAEGPDYGDYSILVDGQPTNLDTRKPATSEIPLPGPEVFHNYLNELYVARDRTLGMFQLSAGRHILSFIVNGKDPHSVGYNLGINDVVLEKVEKAADTPDVREQMTGTAIGMVYRGFPLISYVARLHGASPEERPILIRAIGSFGFDAASASPQLIAALSDPSAKIRAAAAAALAQVGAHSSPEAIPALAKALSDPEPEVRDLAATALGSMGGNAAPAVPELIIALSDPVDYVRAPAADALGNIGPKAGAAVMPLAQRLSTKDEGFVLDSVAYALGDIGPAAKDALPALQQVLKERRLGSIAQEAILKIQGMPVAVYHH